MPNAIIQSEERYISLLTDFGFKRIFGTDPNKELLINFLNSLFDGEEVIKDVKYLNSENVGDSDKWMYVLKNLSRLDNRPAALREKIFTKLFEVASVAHFTPTELREYEDSLKAYRDIKDCLDTAKEEGREEGMEEGLAKGREEGLAISFPYSSYLEGREPYSSLKNLANCLGDMPTL